MPGFNLTYGISEEYDVARTEVGPSEVGLKLVVIEVESCL